VCTASSESSSSLKMLKFVKVFDVEEDIRSVPFSETEHSRKDLRGPLEGHAVASVHEETDLRVVGHERDGFLVLCRIHHEKQRVYFDLFDVQSMKKYFLFEFRGAANVVSASVDPARKYIAFTYVNQSQEDSMVEDVGWGNKRTFCVDLWDILSHERLFHYEVRGGQWIQFLAQPNKSSLYFLHYVQEASIEVFKITSEKKLLGQKKRKLSKAAPLDLPSPPVWCQWSPQLAHLFVVTAKETSNSTFQTGEYEGEGQATEEYTLFHFNLEKGKQADLRLVSDVHLFALSDEDEEEPRFSHISNSMGSASEEKKFGGGRRGDAKFQSVSYLPRPQHDGFSSSPSSPYIASLMSPDVVSSHASPPSLATHEYQQSSGREGRGQSSGRYSADVGESMRREASAEIGRYSWRGIDLSGQHLFINLVEMRGGILCLCQQGLTQYKRSEEGGTTASIPVVLNVIHGGEREGAGGGGGKKRLIQIDVPIPDDIDAEKVRLYFGTVADMIMVYYPGVIFQLVDCGILHEAASGLRLTCGGDRDKEVRDIACALIPSLPTAEDERKKAESKARTRREKREKTRREAEYAVERSSIASSSSAHSHGTPPLKTEDHAGGHHHVASPSQPVSPHSLQYPVLLPLDLLPIRRECTALPDLQGHSFIDATTGQLFEYSLDRHALSSAISYSEPVSNRRARLEVEQLRIRALHALVCHLHDDDMAEMALSTLALRDTKQITYSLMKEYVLGASYSAMQKRSLPSELLVTLPVSTVSTLSGVPTLVLGRTEMEEVVEAAEEDEDFSFAGCNVEEGEKGREGSDEDEEMEEMARGYEPDLIVLPFSKGCQDSVDDGEEGARTLLDSFYWPADSMQSQAAVVRLVKFLHPSEKRTVSNDDSGKDERQEREGQDEDEAVRTARWLFWEGINDNWKVIFSNSNPKEKEQVAREIVTTAVGAYDKAQRDGSFRLHRALQAAFTFSLTESDEKRGRDGVEMMLRFFGVCEDLLLPFPSSLQPKLFEGIHKVLGAQLRDECLQRGLARPNAESALLCIQDCSSKEEVVRLVSAAASRSLSPGEAISLFESAVETLSFENGKQVVGSHLLEFVMSFVRCASSKHKSDAARDETSYLEGKKGSGDFVPSTALISMLEETAQKYASSSKWEESMKLAQVIGDAIFSPGAGQTRVDTVGLSSPAVVTAITSLLSLEERRALV